MVFLTFFLIGISLLPSSSPAEATVVGAVQTLFQAISERNAELASRVLLEEAHFLSLRPDGSVQSKGRAEFLQQLHQEEVTMEERIAAPHILVRGKVATVWAPYWFFLDGNLSHCGTDSISLLLTEKGWKIATLVYDVASQNCPEPPPR